jgi:hypothetical protein
LKHYRLAIYCMVFTIWTAGSMQTGTRGPQEREGMIIVSLRHSHEQTKTRPTRLTGLFRGFQEHFQRVHLVVHSRHVRNEITLVVVCLGQIKVLLVQIGKHLFIIIGSHDFDE